MLIKEQSVLPVEIYLFSDDTIKVPPFVFSGMRGDLVAASCSEDNTKQTFHVSIENHMKYNLKKIKVINTFQHTNALSVWNKPEPLKKEDIIIECERKHIINCFRVLFDNL